MPWSNAALRVHWKQHVSGCPASHMPGASGSEARRSSYEKFLRDLPVVLVSLSYYYYYYYY